MNILRSLFDHEYKELKKFRSIADKIELLKDEYSNLSDGDLKNKTTIFKERLNAGETLEDILVEAFATAREAAKRTIGEYPFYVQLLGGIAIHYGNIAEMKTGEGKTLTTVLPAYLNSLTGKGVHVITVNEYLTLRNAEWMGKVFEFLGVTVGVNLRELTPSEKKKEYDKDILYTTNNELGFDYLRDNMVVKKENRVQRGLNFAILDEVDSILIDEARTPLIISGGHMESKNLYNSADIFVKTLIKEQDYTIDEKTKSVSLSEEGSDKACKYFKLDNLYDISNTALVHHIDQALKANYAMQRDVDYVVQDNEVIIVDQFTGRLMKGRAFSEGLHQAIEAKEGVKIADESKTLATITFQNYFRMYDKLSGMTGTAMTEESEFQEIYHLDVVSIPTNKPMIRKDLSDIIYKNEKAKFRAVVKDVKESYEKGQPVLVGTVSIESSELLSNLLKRHGIPHNVLNAKQHAREAEIIAHAGEKGAVTIATNMAGRGTDIKLGEGVVELGGLAVIGTERHEARRIDNQLRGRAGRQGDPGYSRFYLSAQDELMIRFGGERFERLLGMIANPDVDGNETPLESKMFSRFVESAQKKVEGSNYDRRKSVVEYDEVLRKQREIIYNQRKDILFLDDMEPTIHKMMHSVVSRYIPTFMIDDKKNSVVDATRFMNEFGLKYFNRNDLSIEEIEGLNQNQLEELIENKFHQNLEEKKKAVPLEIFQEFLKVVLLRVVDKYWMDHIDQMSDLRQSIGLQSYAQINPLREYQEIGYQTFNDMIATINDEVTLTVNRAVLRENLQREEQAKVTGTNAGNSETTKRKPIVNKNKVGRNDPCPCGSGKKYKHCCGMNEK